MVSRSPGLSLACVPCSREGGGWVGGTEGQEEGEGEIEEGARWERGGREEREGREERGGSEGAREGEFEKEQSIC